MMRGAQPIRRVLVAVDGSPRSEAAMRAAALIARLFDAELVGLYVEEDQVLLFCDSPLGHEVELLTGSGHKSDRGAVERQFRALAVRARRSLRRAAEPHEVTWSLRVVRGSVSTEVVAAAREAELVAMGRSGRSLRRPHTPGGTLKALLAEGRGSVMVVDDDRTIAPPVRVLYGPGESSGLELVLAARLAAGLDSELIILLAGADPERRMLSARDRIADHGPRTRFHPLGDLKRAALLEELFALRSGVLIVALSQAPGALDGNDLQRLVARARYPVLAVRA